MSLRNPSEPPTLAGLSAQEIVSLLVEWGEPAFRGRQIAEWIYRKGVRDFSGMTNLPASLRDRLTQQTRVASISEKTRRQASDGTVKFLFELGDGETIETVYLPYEDRTTVCLSSQAGCAVGCTFCATGHGGYRRNLTPGEIVEQVLNCQRLGKVTNVVYMGMGEPLLNLDSVLDSLHLLNEEVGIGMRNLTVSTVGIVPKIRQLAEKRLQITLAVSLHAPDDALRHELIPTQHRYSVREIVDACRDYVDQTGRRVTFEYVLLAGVNDNPEQARKLAALLRHLRCNVNLIPFNPVENTHGFRPPDHSRVHRFRAALEQAGLTVTQRQERGQDISAACGQLRRVATGVPTP